MKGAEVSVSNSPVCYKHTFSTDFGWSLPRCSNNYTSPDAYFSGRRCSIEKAYERDRLTKHVDSPRCGTTYALL
jgi:hypothetical protein